jgi:hypothetical protein
MERQYLAPSVRTVWEGAAVILLPLLIASCGGGGGGSGGGATPPNTGPPPPSFAYLSSFYTYTAGRAVGDDENQDSFTAPRNLAGNGRNWSISPALPPGLELSTLDGTILGQPTAASPATIYTVTQSNAGGSTTATLTIAVAASPLLNLGLASGPASIQFSNSKMLSAEGSPNNPYGGWLLQDFASGATLAQGNGEGASTLYVVRWFTDLENDVMVDLTYKGLEVRSATDGSIISTIPEPLTANWYRLATDGSYIAAGSPTALTIWSTSGQVLVSHAGNYGFGVNAFAAPGQIRIANGPAGANVIETIAVPTGDSSVSPVFKGAFNIWFLDGQSFLTNLDNTVWIYSNTAVQLDFTSLPSFGDLAGQGNWFWAFNGDTLNIYKVGASAAPAFSAAFATNVLAYPSGGTLGVISGQSQLTVIDLSGAAPTSATYTLPFSLASYGAQSASVWAVGEGNGVIFDGTSLGSTPRTFNLGAATTIVGGTSYFSIAMATGSINYYNSGDNSLAGSISFPISRLFASADGTVLVAESSEPAPSGMYPTTNIYSLPSGTLVNTVPDNLGFVALSQSGAVIAEGVAPSGTNSCDTQFVPATGGPALYCLSIGSGGFALSPDGTLVAIDLGSGTTAATNIYKNGILVTAVPGSGVFWLDNNRLLVAAPTPVYFQFPPPQPYTIYDSLGNFLGNAATTDNLGCNYACRVVSTDSLFEGNWIVSYMTGAIEWESADYFQQGKSAVAGSQVILAAGDYVLAEPSVASGTN